MFRGVIVACLFQAAVASMAHAAGPFGKIHVGNWSGGAFSDDNTGGFSHCAASSGFAAARSSLSARMPQIPGCSALPTRPFT